MSVVTIVREGNCCDERKSHKKDMKKRKGKRGKEKERKRERETLIESRVGGGIKEHNSAVGL